MKKAGIVFVMLLTILQVLEAKKNVIEGQSFTSFGDYRIEKEETPFLLLSRECRWYNVSYTASDLPLKIVVWKERQTTKYLVLSDRLSVQYVSNGNHLGVEKLEERFKREGYFTNDSKLNRFAYFHQKVIRQGRPEEEECLAFIASYFPQLVVKDPAPKDL